MSKAITLDDIKARYAELCAKRDATEKRIAPLRKKLRAAADEAEKYRVRSMEVAAELDRARGGKEWFELKKEIGLLAKVLNGTTAAKAVS